jgi:plastocyanin
VIAAGITISILAGSAIVSANPPLRTLSLAMFMGLVLIIVASAGLLALGPSLEAGERASGPLPQPNGAPRSTVTVEALLGTKFNATEYTATAGVVEFRLTGAPGHTLQFRTLDYEGFPLKAPGNAATGTVTLKPGEYEIYCTVDSHAAQGMVATITVEP